MIPVGEPVCGAPHGTYAAWDVWRCRCADCRAGHTRDKRAQYKVRLRQGLVRRRVPEPLPPRGSRKRDTDTIPARA